MKHRYNYHARQPRIAALMRQHHADRADRAPCPIRIDPRLDSRPDCYAYTHAQVTRQDRLKRQRSAQRKAKQVVNDSAVYLAQFDHDAVEIVIGEDIVWF